ncbi:hypothetical protein HDU92_001406 [Lobulomyces angularis]|nr:hypothetical protein HDU92_001406 [Lobulomyces angularis]
MISCFNILLPNIITRENSDRASNSAANVSSIQETIKSFGMGSHFYSIEIDISNSDLGIKENAENKIIFDTLRSSIIVLTKHLEKTKEMITKLSRLDLEADSEKIKENTVKKLIYFKNMLEANKAKYLELNINPGNLIINDEYTDDDSNEEDHIFEEVQTEGACSSTQQPSTFLERKSTSFSNLKYDRKILPLNAKVKKRADDNQKKNNISSQKIEFVRKPVSDDKGKVVGDIIIKGDYNGSSDEEEYILNNNGFEFSHHGWNRVGENPTVSSKTLKNIVRKYIKVTTLPPSNIQPCKVKSSKTGKLCERKDLVTCPIHGPIIPRDDTGRALDNIIAEKEEAQDKQEGKKQLWEILANDIETQTESFAENSAKRRRLVSKREKPTARDRLEKKFKLADKK